MLPVRHRGNKYPLALLRDADQSLENTQINSRLMSWKGTWSMNHDGWQGTLTINTITPLFLGISTVSGTYLTSEKKSLPFFGSIPTGRPHLITINIPFTSDNNQRFDLMYHTWEDGVFSGVTYWGGKKFGVQGFK